jgi:hypothetical protein
MPLIRARIHWPVKSAVSWELRRTAGRVCHQRMPSALARFQISKSLVANNFAQILGGDAGQTVCALFGWFYLTAELSKIHFIYC